MNTTDDLEPGFLQPQSGGGFNAALPRAAASFAWHHSSTLTVPFHQLVGAAGQPRTRHTEPIITEMPEIVNGGKQICK
jgi:hypothetical protein